MHYIWGTKSHQPIISKALIPKLIAHYKEKYPKGGEIYVDTTNGIANHFHLLVGQFPVMAPSKVANLLKGESSHWINIFSVSHSMVETVRKYIFNQQEHHRKTTFEEEVSRFLEAHEIEMIK